MSSNNTQELVHSIAYHPAERIVLFRSLPIAERGAILEMSSNHIQSDILSKLENAEIIELLEHYDFYRAEHIVMRISDRSRRQSIVDALKTDVKTKLDVFLRFSPRATAGLINMNYILVAESTTIGAVADEVEVYHHKTGKLPEVLIQRDGVFVGGVSFAELIRNPNRETMRTHTVTLQTVPYTIEVNDLVHKLKHSEHSRVVVLGEEGDVLGVVYSDDILSLLGVAGNSLYNFAGVDDTERPFDSVSSKVNSRYKWLIINLGTAFLAASVVSAFQDTLSQLVILAAYMPIIAGMGGNAATQTLAVLVRGIAVGEIDLKNGMPAIKREVLTGLVNGIINGLIVAIVCLFWSNDIKLGLVVAASMVINLVVAGFFGALVPLIMKACGKDPATSATIFITTATDVLGFLSLLGLATLILL